MNADELREALALLHWSQRQLAVILGAHPTTVFRWATGELPIPPVIANWLEILAATHARNPPPPNWRPPAQNT